MSIKEQYPSMTILGSTGSVGEQAIDVARQTGAKVNAICANRNAARVEEQVREFGVSACAMSDEDAAKDLKTRLADTNVHVYAGMDGVCEMISERYDEDEVVLNSVIGEAGLRPTLATLSAGKKYWIFFSLSKNKPPCCSLPTFSRMSNVSAPMWRFYTMVR